MASRQHQRPRHTRIPSASSTATAATATSNASTTIGHGAASSMSSNSTAGGPAPSTIRRNLFAGQVNRRIASNSSTSSGSVAHQQPAPAQNNNNTNNHNTHTSAQAAPAFPAVNGVVSGDGAGAAGPLSGTTSSSTLSRPVAPVSDSLPAPLPLVDGDIVARDQNGLYKVDAPALPSGTTAEDLGEDGEHPMEGVEGAGDTSASGMNVGKDAEMSSFSQESMAFLKLDESINEMMHRHRSRQVNGEPSEVYLLIQQSLRNRVASLDDDRWMYETEDDIRV